MPTYTTISAGSVSAISLAAGSTLKLSGAGTAQLTPPGVPGTDNALRTVSGELSFGPYPIACTVLASAAPSSNGLRYYTIGATDAVPPGGAQSGAGPLSADSLQGLVSGAGNPYRWNTGIRSWAQEAATNAASNQTFGVVTAVERDYDAVRVILQHVDTNAISGVLVAVAAGGDYAGNKNGAGLTWVNATFGGSASGTLPAGAAARPSLLATDWISLQSVARTDGGALPLIYARAYLPNGANPVSLINASAASQLNAVSDGRVTYSTMNAGDCITMPANFVSTTSRDFLAILAIQYRSRGKICSYAAFGDSITRGNTTSVAYRSWAELAAISRSQAGVPTQAGNFGWSGQQIAAIYNRAADLIPLLKPPMAVMPVFSPNGGPPTQAFIDNARFYTGQFIALCQANVVIPVIWTPAPNNGASYSAAQDNLRKTIAADVRTLYRGVAAYFDADAALSDGATPASFLPGLSTDGTHPNDAGHAVMGARFVSDVLAQLGS